jgi:hypothetical protein
VVYACDLPGDGLAASLVILAATVNRRSSCTRRAPRSPREAMPRSGHAEGFGRHVVPHTDNILTHLVETISNRLHLRPLFNTRHGGFHPTVTTSPRPPALLSPDFFADPYPTYHSLRAADPVMWDETLLLWVLSGYNEVAAALNDGRLVCGRTEEEQAVILDQLDASGQGELRPLRKLLWRMMLFSDPPAHTRLRALANRAFTPSAIERLRPRIPQTRRQRARRSSGDRTHGCDRGLGQSSTSHRHR